MHALQKAKWAGVAIGKLNMIADDATAVIEKLVGCLKNVDELGYPIAAAHISNAIEVLRESQPQSLSESEAS